jgi:hypothetical protein
MKKVIITCFILVLASSYVKSQTQKAVNTFPEDYVGKTITFKDTRFWPILEEREGYYVVQIDVAKSLLYDQEWGFGLMQKIVGVVKKDIAKQMINIDIGGYDNYYYGTLKGKVIKNDAIWPSKFMFVISKIINHPPSEPNNIIHKFE